MFINYAHRGASEYMPENTLSAFYLGLFQGANGIETDVKRTKDGVLVLFHDDILDKKTNGIGNIHDFTYKELLEFDVTGKQPDKSKKDKIVAFEDFLKYFAFRDISFAVELKDEYIEKEVLTLINRYNAGEKTIITSFNFDNLRRVKELDEKIKVGYLIKEGQDEKIEEMRVIGGYQICPSAKGLTSEYVLKIRSEGFSVRAHGVSNTEIMESVYNCNVDGMTVNFPDKLKELIDRCSR